MRQPVSIGEALKKFIDKYPHRRQLKRGMIMSLWGPMVGSTIAVQCRVLHFEGSRLVVHVGNPGWRQELHMQRYSIMKRLNAEVKEDIISEIIVRA